MRKIILLSLILAGLTGCATMRAYCDRYQKAVHKCECAPAWGCSPMK